MSDIILGIRNEWREGEAETKRERGRKQGKRERSERAKNSLSHSTIIFSSFSETLFRTFRHLVKASFSQLSPLSWNDGDLVFDQ